MDMAKHRRVWNDAVYGKYLSEGRGQGVGANYKPWIVIQDFPSLGMVSRVSGTTTGRIHHLMSNLELYLFYLLDWSDNVIDIREQYPLSDIADAIYIAEKAGIKYPYDLTSGFPYIMTSDFYVDTRQGPQVISVKPSTELSKQRVREKLEIERRYWAARGIGWSIMTENEINRVKARNIEWLAQAKDLGLFGLSISVQDECREYFLDVYRAGYLSLFGILNAVEDEFDVAAGTGLNVYKHLSYWKRIEFDADREVDFLEFSANRSLCYAGGAL